MSSDPPTLYFGYGSNLWLHQMSTRCPSSTYLGIARLDAYKWIINERGYANIIPLAALSSSTPHVYGLIFSLTPHDESRLDINEGVPLAYTKEYLPATFWSSSSSSPNSKIDISLPPSETDKPVLVYIDRKRVTEGKPREEYVYRMNRGIEDAVKCGVPEEYVRGVMRAFIPEDDGGKEGGEMGEFAKRQAAGFRDESGVIE
ncbi:hypothetical protein COCMIDRAFT_99394 [Bipolaris oryzae ATCC 44560]|uniref:gamma-glutamylcyclotransferase n=1 Tax=Bipolaris oryzae ATCC 44560 TaxID=930090 RepID=W6Z8Y8_COCMI|nr:uncharacterized protein COCMIDRAFT_99394 [Bipolaris oryzae ATCC 44560]EUC44014.1 hypothetical protein COCMIDRAFT_99394 [Bipolaris oryzae ATCC 44560]